jgi:hypothetical protein
MYSLDRRTRTSADIREVDVGSFFGDELPALMEAQGHLAAGGAAELQVEPFTFVTPAGAFTLALDDGRFSVVSGDVGAASVRLDDGDVAAIVNDLKTPMTILTAGSLEMARGDLGDFLDWWVVLRSLIDGQEAYTRGSVDYTETDGSTLDLHRSFAPDDDDRELAHFLHQAGFLHLRQWFDPAEMAQISCDMDAALPTYVPDDGRSWWARTATGEHRCVRMQWFDEHSPTTASILDGERLARIAGLPGDGHGNKRFGTSRVEALEKPVGVVEGISDVPWHKDCSLGMHSYNCCGLTVGLSVTGADDGSGQLRVVAGSHRALVQPTFLRKESDLPVIDLPTSAGDVTVHCSCTLHMSQPPISGERRVLYTGFGLRSASVDRDAVDEIRRVREGAYKAVSQAPGHVT